MKTYSKADAGCLLAFVSTEDCVEYFGTMALISAMDDKPVLSTYTDDSIISYLEEKGYVISKKKE